MLGVDIVTTLVPGGLRRKFSVTRESQLAVKQHGASSTNL
jgi:hypothetical protein